jgi:hypothetical protein
VKVRGVDAAEARGEQSYNLSIRDEDVRRADDCGDGTTSPGVVDTRTVPAGTYYVGIKPQSSVTGGNYSISVRDTGYATSGGNTVAGGCTSGSTIDVPVTANTDYYVMVKGEAAGAQGAFDLTLTDIGSLAGTVTDIGCGDLSATDAFYQFTVAGAPYDAGNRKNIEVAFADASFDGAFKLMLDVGNDGSVTNDTAVGSCYSGVSASHTYGLLPGRYYVVAKGRSVANGASEMPMQLSIRDLDAIGSMECADGTTTTPAVIEPGTPLPAGTYYVAFTGQAGSQGAYELLFSNLDVPTGGSASQIECTSPSDPVDPGVIDLNVAAGNDYYVIVKGNGAADRGAYTLAITDTSQIEAIDPACPSDITAPDGYAAFNVASGPRDITIDMTGSALVGAVQVFEADGDTVPGCNCFDTSTPVTCTLQDGDYYVLFRAIVGAANNGTQPFELELRDDSNYGSLACDDGLIAGGASVQRALTAGTYYVGIAPSRTNVAAATNYTLTINDASVAALNGAAPIACGDNAATANVLPGRTYHAVVKGKNAADQGNYKLNIQDTSGVPSFGCGDDIASPDAFYQFQVTNPAGTRVTIDTEGSQLPTVVALFPQGASFTTNVRDNATGLCCALREESPGAGQGSCTDGLDNNSANGTDAADPNCAGAGQCRSGVTCDARPDALIACDSNSGPAFSSRIYNQLLTPGIYNIVVRGRAFTFPAMPPAGYPDLPFNLSVRDEQSISSITCAATSDTPVRTTLDPGTYHVALTGGSSGSQRGPYVLGLRESINDPDELACNTSSDSITYNVEAGHPYYVLVKGGSAAERGNYRLTAENFELSSNMGCNADPLSPDAFYRFHLDAETTVQISTAGSQLDTVIALYPVGVPYFGTNYASNSTGTLINCDDDGGGGYGASAITQTLAAGDYYIVVKGKIGSGAAYGANSLSYSVSVRDYNANAPIACTPGSSAITQTLPAGDYKVVVSSPNSTGAAYTIDFRDMTALDNAATLLASDDTNDQIIYDLRADTPYYVVVKGDGAASAAGDYGLTVESLDDTATSMGCGADPLAADAFFRFILTEETTITADTEGSLLDTVLAIYPGNATSFGTNYANDVFGDPVLCNNDFQPGNTASRVSGTLGAGVYYAVVKGTSRDWGASSLPFNLSIRDEAANGSITCADVASGSRIAQALDAGDYIAVLSDTQEQSQPGSGGAYSITFRDLNAEALEGGTAIGCGLGSLNNMPVQGGEKYYVVVKGNQHGPNPTPFDMGTYSLSIDDAQATQAGSGGSPIACAAEGSSIDATYPPGEYYAVVTGPNSGTQNGDFTLRMQDVDAFESWNRIACDDDSGPNETSVIEAELQPGTHYVVVKGDGPSAVGSYHLNVRDLDVYDDRRLDCAGDDDSGDDRIEADVFGNRDYTVLLKGTGSGEEGAYNIKLFDEEGLGSSGGALRKCQVVCPNIQPYASGNPTAGDCTNAQLTGTPGFTENLAPGTYYMSIKGRRATEESFYELQIGDPNLGMNNTRYVPRTFTETRDALLDTGAKILPVLACNGGSDCPQAQARALSEVGCTPVIQGGQTVYRNCAGPVNQATGQGQYYTINSNGSNIGSGLATAVRDLASYMSMDITLSTDDNPPFDIEVQKCTNPADPQQAAVCRSFSTGCLDASLTPRNTVRNCQPGSTPKFLVEFTNPTGNQTCPSCTTPGATQVLAGACPNCADPNGGYHFTLKLVGDNQYLLEEIPVYIIPTAIPSVGPDPDPGAGSFEAMGEYTQQVFGNGCYYYLSEGEDDGISTCNDNMDNDGDGRIDRGRDMNNDLDFDDTGDVRPEEGCLPGSCTDGIDNDGDGDDDLSDDNCTTNKTQVWSDMYFRADIPPGTSISFDVCTADTEAELATDCDYATVATVTSSAGSCATDSDCSNVTVGGMTRSGFCGAGGQCQFVSPQKTLMENCASDADCEVGTRNGEWEASFCNAARHCQYTTPPADVATALDEVSGNGKPYAQVRVRLNANTSRSEAPILESWYLTYECGGGN